MKHRVLEWADCQSRAQSVVSWPSAIFQECGHQSEGAIESANSEDDRVDSAPVEEG